MNSNKNQTMKSNSVYTVDEFNSGDGMLTQVWGPGMWHFLHTMSFNYPIRPSEHDKKHYRDFILSMQHILPCGKCRDNLKKNFKTLSKKIYLAIFEDLSIFEDNKNQLKKYNFTFNNIENNKDYILNLCKERFLEILNKKIDK